MANSRKRRRVPRAGAYSAEDKAKEDVLSKALFGNSTKRSQAADHSKDSNEGSQDPYISSLIFGNDSKRATDDGSDREHESDSEMEDSALQCQADKSKTSQAVWIDDDDEEVAISLAGSDRLRKLRETESEDVVSGRTYTKKLRQHFEKMNSNLKWAARPSQKKVTSSRLSDDSEAETDDEVYEDNQDEIFANGESVVSGMGGSLPSATLTVRRVKDGNAAEMSKSVVKSVRFHESGQMLMTAGLDKKLRFFKFEEKKNTKVQSIFINDMPINTAEFFKGASGSDEVIASGRRPFFYTYDLKAGKINRINRIIGRKEKSLEKFVCSRDGKYIAFFGNDGYLILVSGRTKQWIADLKMNGTVRAASFTADSRFLYSAGSDGIVYKWDIGSRRCLWTSANEGGGVNISALTVDRQDSYLAVGSASGVVNLYQTNARCVKEDGSMLSLSKSFMNLTTDVDELRFNHDSQVLAMSSSRIKDSLKMVHIPSKTVFSNWPTSKTPLKYVTSLDFSPHSGYFAIGNDHGVALLYRLNHYGKA